MLPGTMSVDMSEGVVAIVSGNCPSSGDSWDGDALYATW